MTLSKTALETLKRAPFVLATASEDPNDLCRKGLLAWTAGAWRLTEAGGKLLAELDGTSAAA